MNVDAIQIDHLSCYYGERLAVNNLSVSIQSGSILGLIGSNGAGKTTTMKAIAGLIQPADGTITVNGLTPKNDALDFRTQVAYLPDEPQLFPEMTVFDHLRFFASAYRQKFDKAKTLAFLEKWGLFEKRHTPASRLSRGMRQKLAFCCQLPRSPRLFILDEPFTGLDPHGIQQLKEALLENAKKGACIIISSHLLAVVEDLCSHLLMLETGNVSFFGSMEAMRLLHEQGHDNNQRLEDFFHTFPVSQNKLVDSVGVGS